MTVADRCNVLWRVPISRNKSFGTVDPGSLRGCQRQSQTDAMYRGGSKLALSRLAPGILEVCEGAKDSSRPVQCTREIP